MAKNCLHPTTATRVSGAAKNPRIVAPPGEGCWRKVLAAVAPAFPPRAVLDAQLSPRARPALLAIDSKTPHRCVATLITGCDAPKGEPLARIARDGPGHKKTRAHPPVYALPAGALGGKSIDGGPL